jgi:hypothetical protein
MPKAGRLDSRCTYPVVSSAAYWGAWWKHEREVPLLGPVTGTVGLLS